MSCSDKFLDQKPLNFLSPENTFIDAKGLQAPLDAALKLIMDEFNGTGNPLQFNMNMSDVSVVGATDKPDAYVDLRTYATPQNARANDAGQATTFYKNCYSGLMDVNTVIDYIDQIKWVGGKDDPVRNHLLGTAYFLRAFFYYQQTLQFGNCAFVLNLVTTARQDFKAFTMQSIWDQMIVDLEWAKKYVKPGDQLAKGQIPNTAVRILLTKYYMMNLRYADAEAEMTAIINSGIYKLVTDADINVATVMVGANINPTTGATIPGRSAEVKADAINFLHMKYNANKVKNKEAIWVFANDYGYVGNIEDRSRWVRAFGPNFVSPNQGVQAPSGGAGMDTRQGLGIMMMKWGRGQGFSRITNYAQYDIWNYNGAIDTIDYRHKSGNWFYMGYLLYDNPSLAGNTWYLKPLTLWSPTTGALLCKDTIRCWFGYPMYKFWCYDYTNPTIQEGGQNDFYVYRLAEAYLLRSEARFWQGNNQGAADDLNVIRQRANAKKLYTAGDLQTGGIGAILDERARELYGEEFRHDELVRISVILAKSGKPCYNGETYSVSGTDLEVSLSAKSFYFDRMMEKNSFFRNNVPWATYPTTKYTMDPKHIFWPIYEPYIIGNVGNILNQTTGYDGSEKNVAPLVHVVQPAGKPNIDPMVAIGER
ncbi:MAG: RagB/SusD family nutrient uptake outer membrane protein [Bacteroidales bacterium]|nr:RagB/SusD family nutrient uptake outer membrane protein [Bacteroidales bacterium]